MHMLCELVRTEPMLSSCVQRLGNNCLTNTIELYENSKPLTPDLGRLLSKHYSHLLRQAIEVALVTGFVPFYIRRRQGIPLVFIPELGTFVWTTVVQDKASSRVPSGILKYNVRMLMGSVKDEDIHVVNWQVPLNAGTQVSLHSPLWYVFSMHRAFDMALKMALEKERWNTHKHLVVSEKLDLKDPTPSGIQLLDDMRRYSLTGQHNMMRDAVSDYYSRRDNRKLHSVVDANHQWIYSEFTKDDSSAQAVPHIMPPNSSTEELSLLQSTDVLPQMREQYHSAVHTFFNGLNMPSSDAKYVGAAGSEQASRAQHVSVLAMCRFLQSLVEHMHATSFGVDECTVTCVLQPRSRFELSGSDDMKNLLECGVFTNLDKPRLRKLYMGSDVNAMDI